MTRTAMPDSEFGGGADKDNAVRLPRHKFLHHGLNRAVIDRADIIDAHKTIFLNGQQQDRRGNAAAIVLAVLGRFNVDAFFAQESRRDDEED